jgi:hypothetical protein
VTPYTFRAMWPVEDDEAGYAEARAFAATEVHQLAEDAGARVVGDVVWEMVENDKPLEWPHTDLVLVAVAPALPIHPTREQYPALIRYYAGQQMTDPQIGELLGVPRDSVIYVRRKHDIPAGRPPGRPPGYRSPDEIAEPARNAA